MVRQKATVTRGTQHPTAAEARYNRMDTNRWNDSHADAHTDLDDIDAAANKTNEGCRSRHERMPIDELLKEKKKTSLFRNKNGSNNMQ